MKFYTSKNEMFCLIIIAVLEYNKNGYEHKQGLRKFANISSVFIFTIQRRNFEKKNV